MKINTIQIKIVVQKPQNPNFDQGFLILSSFDKSENIKCKNATNHKLNFKDFWVKKASKNCKKTRFKKEDLPPLKSFKWSAKTIFELFIQLKKYPKTPNLDRRPTAFIKKLGTLKTPNHVKSETKTRRF